MCGNDFRRRLGCGMKNELLPVTSCAARTRPTCELRQPSPACHTAETLSAGSRSFFGNRFVYAVISQRARGLSIGINLNPDKFCNFDCVYCEVDRRQRGAVPRVQLEVMAAELRQMLGLAQQGRIRELPGYESAPEELLELKEVALSGDGEPSLCPNFAEVVETVVHIRAQAAFPFFKIVLITNATGLHSAEVKNGLRLFTLEDEVWAKLEAGSQEAMDRINRPRNSQPNCPAPSLALVLENILNLGRERPIVIQSLFPLLDGSEPVSKEIDQYVQRLRELREAGAQISLVQIYSAHRPAVRRNCGHLPLRSLSQIARRIRDVAGLRAEVF
jgi:wyosine [tRNA(Phe)-imidazoG37] synthetase (radical SAM superfamily)